MKYIIRFATPDGPTHLTRAPGDQFRVGARGDGAIRAARIPADRAERFDNASEAKLALGSFIIWRGGWNANDWIAQPSLIEVEEGPMLLSSAKIGDREISLHFEEGHYVVRYSPDPKAAARRTNRADAVAEYVHTIRELLA